MSIPGPVRYMITAIAVFKELGTEKYRNLNVVVAAAKFVICRRDHAKMASPVSG